MSLDFVESGSLEKPGPIGRIFRLLLGIFCLYGVNEIVRDTLLYVADPIGQLPAMSLMILVAICVFNYVVNIGYSRN